MTSAHNNLQTLIDEGGSYSVSTLSPDLCAAAASDGSNCLAMLKRRNGESLDALLKRLDLAVARAWSDGIYADEVNKPTKSP